MLEELPRHLLPGPAGADDHSFLDVARVTPACSSCSSARKRDEYDCTEPEDADLVDARVAEAPQTGAGEDDPSADRDDVEDSSEVVDRTVICSLLVSVVEAVDLRDEHPDRQGQRKQPGLFRLEPQ